MQQYRHFRRNFPESVLLFQVGRFFEFYERRDEPVARVLDLKPMRSNGRDARYGFPVGALRLYLPRLIAENRTVVVIAERDEYLTAIKTRLPVSRYEPVASGEGRYESGSTLRARTKLSILPSPAEASSRR